MALNKFFRFPFATTGSKAAVPDAVQPDGSVSYTEGFGPDYEADPGSDPDAKPVPRDQTNQLYYDLTTAVREYQIMGVPDYITSAQNGGSPFAYAKNARVRWTDGETYRSLANGNTADPSNTAAWVLDTLPPALATESEARARTNNIKYISPLRLQQAVEQLFIDNSGTGWKRDPGTGIITQWGTINVAPNGNNSVANNFSFNIPFVGPQSGIKLTGNPTSIMRPSWSGLSCIMKVDSLNGGSFILDTCETSAPTSLATTINWIAIGK